MCMHVEQGRHQHLSAALDDRAHPCGLAVARVDAHNTAAVHIDVGWRGKTSLFGVEDTYVPQHDRVREPMRQTPGQRLQHFALGPCLSFLQESARGLPAGLDKAHIPWIHVGEQSRLRAGSQPDEQRLGRPTRDRVQDDLPLRRAALQRDVVKLLDCKLARGQGVQPMSRRSQQCPCDECLEFKGAVDRNVQGRLDDFDLAAISRRMPADRVALALEVLRNRTSKSRLARDIDRPGHSLCA